jgi:transcriptional regulator with XRE-family HTH domain
VSRKLAKEVCQVTGKSFGGRLRELRMGVDKSMGQVAREVGVTGVYYAEVENGKKPPFPRKGEMYSKLSAALTHNSAERQEVQKELEELATAVRGRLEIDLSASNQEARSVALLFARRLGDESLTEEQLRKLRQILETPPP